MNSSLISIRQEEIYNFISKSNVVTIQEISEALNLSQSTIRRDLKALEDDNRIISFHGGVSVNTGYGTFSERTSKNISEKRKIAKAASDLIENNDFIYIGGGSTTYEFANTLSKRTNLNGVTVVCSAMNISRCFISNKSFKVIVPGGVLESEDESMHSQMTIDIIRNFNFTKAFVGTQAVNAKKGYTIPRLNLGELKEVVQENSEQLIILCDHTKIGKTSAYKVCDIEKVSTIITDYFQGSEDELKEIEKHGTKVIRV